MKKVVFASLALALTVPMAHAEENLTPGLRDRRIGYVLTDDHWAVHATKDGKAECPDGVNDGPREQYEKIFPVGSKRKLVDADLKREAEIWMPDLTPDQFVWKEALGNVVNGVNLDGKIKPNDYTDDSGEKGIDNEFFRVLGCVDIYRPGNGVYDLYNHYMQSYNYTRTVIELTNVDSLLNDDDVTVNVYRGLDQMLTDGSGNSHLPYGPMRIDTRWGKEFRATFHGRIKDGVLLTEPGDVTMPQNYVFEDFSTIKLLGSQLKLRVLSDSAVGVWGGYVDIEAFYRGTNGSLSTHSISYGRLSAASMYRALYKRADGFPDPKTGKNRGISGAKEVKFKQVFIDHTGDAVASDDKAPKQKQTASAAP